MRKTTRFVLSVSAVAGTAIAILACTGPVGSGEDQANDLPAFGLVTPQQAAGVITELLGENEFVLLDIRRDSEIEAGHIPGAESLDFYGVTFQDDLAQLDRKKTYLLYCRTGNRTGRTYRMMEDLGFGRVYDMAGGISAWFDLGYPVCLGPLEAEHACSGEYPDPA